WLVKEQSLARAVQAFGFARKHWPGRFEGAALGLLDHTAIKQAENALAFCFEPFHLFVGFLKQKAINVQDAPFERAQQIAHPLGACGGRLGESRIAAQIRPSFASQESLLLVPKANDRDTTLHERSD